MLTLGSAGVKTSVSLVQTTDPKIRSFGQALGLAVSALCLLPLGYYGGSSRVIALFSQSTL